MPRWLQCLWLKGGGGAADELLRMMVWVWVWLVGR